MADGGYVLSHYTTQGVGRNGKHLKCWLQYIIIDVLAEPYLTLFLPCFFSAQGEHLHPQ